VQGIRGLFGPSLLPVPLLDLVPFSTWYRVVALVRLESKRQYVPITQHNELFSELMLPIFF
jgi:hypothetical protein